MPSRRLSVTVADAVADYLTSESERQDITKSALAAALIVEAITARTGEHLPPPARWGGLRIETPSQHHPATTGYIQCSVCNKPVEFDAGGWKPTTDHSFAFVCDDCTDNA